MAHPDLPAEQSFLDEAYQRLEVLRADAQAQLKEAFIERGGTFQSYTERDIRVRNSLSRLEKLELGREALVFGRLDRLVGGGDGEPGPGPVGEESYHIGRLAISDAQHEPLVVDWRAPVAEPFYRATGAHPMGLRLRRHFLSEGRHLVDLEDELFPPEGSDGSVRATGLSGPGVLMAALARAHTGRMRDIVATVQAEQDEIIRAPLPGALVVQGGPGTGKTAVALHRAAYLLYTHRFPLEGQGVLVVGPNPTFLRYIDQVLPSLGETGVEMSTANGLYRRARASGAEPEAVARLKGDPRMAQLLRRAVRQRQRPLRRRVDVPYGRLTLSVTPEASEELVASARRRAGTHNARRRALEAQLWRHLAAEVDRLEQRAAGSSLPGAPGRPGDGRTGGPGGAGPGGAGPVELAASLRRRPEVSEMLERMWPRLSAEELLHDFLGAPALVEAAARGLLSPAEASLLHRPRSATAEDVAWTSADIALLDEASALLGPTRRSDREVDGVRTYGHIVVDEAQDLTPMQLRMVGRRSLSGSMTLVGDIAQATGAWAPASWRDVVGHLPVRGNWRQVGLSVSYRAPAEVMRVAARVLSVALPGTLPPEPVRDTGEAPVVVEAGPGGLEEAVVAAVATEVAAVAAVGRGEDGSVGVLVPEPALEGVSAALRASGTAVGMVGAGALDTQVSVLALQDAKGLEFDSVVVVEPAAVLATAQGARALYVALTRCTRRLSIVHQQRLPQVLASALETGGGEAPLEAERP